MVDEAKAGQGGGGQGAGRRGLVRAQRPRGALASRRLRRLHPLRGRRQVSAARNQHQRVGSRSAGLLLPRRERAGGLPRPVGRVPAADRGRGAPAERVGLRPLPGLDRARVRRRRGPAVCGARGRHAAAATTSSTRSQGSPSATAPASSARRATRARPTRSSPRTATFPTAPVGLTDRACQLARASASDARSARARLSAGAAPSSSSASIASASSGADSPSRPWLWSQAARSSCAWASQYG